MPRFLHFNEGPGFYPLCKLGSGRSGNVTLVKNSNLGVLARKEDSAPILGHKLTERLSHVSLVRPSPITDFEGLITYHLQHIPDVVRLLGCARYVRTNDCHTHINYYQYHNLGSLDDFHQKRLLKKQRIIPEYWLAKLLISMMTTLTSVHHSSVVHRDTLPRNWLLQYESPQDVKIILADLGVATHRSMGLYEDWILLRRKDYMGIHQSMRQIMTDRNGEDMPGYSAIFERFIIQLQTFLDKAFRKDFPTDEAFDAALTTWLDKVKQHASTLSPEDWPQKPRNVDNQYAADLERNSGLEQRFLNETKARHYSFVTVDGAGEVTNIEPHAGAEEIPSLTRWCSIDEMHERVADQEEAKTLMAAASQTEKK